MLKGAAQEVIVGAVTDPSFGKLVAFGLGGILVEVLKDITFRLAPASTEDALSMLDGIKAAEILRGVRGADPIDREALAAIVVAVSNLVADFPEIQEVDLNPIFATKDGATAVDALISVDFAPKKEMFRPSPDEILGAMERIMNPRAVAVIGASAEDGKIGNSVMKNLINGGFQGEIYPVHPKADEILGKKAYKSVLDIPGEVDVAVFAIPAKFAAPPWTRSARKGAGRRPHPLGLRRGRRGGAAGRAGRGRAQARRARHGAEHLRLLLHAENLCATFCTPYDVRGKVALSSQSGGVGMSIIGFSRSTRMGVSAIVGLGNKSDLDEDDLLTYFEQDDNTQAIAMHFEDLKDGRAFAEVAKRVSKKKPVIVLKAGRTAYGAKAPPRTPARWPATTRSTTTCCASPA